MNIKVGEKRSDTIQQRSISGVSFKFQVVHNAVNTAFAGLVLDFSKMTVRGILKRDGQTITIFADTLKALAIESSFFTAQIESALAAQISGTQGLQQIQVQTAGLVNIVAINVAIDFRSTLNISGDDSFEFFLDFNNAAAQAVTVNTSTTLCEADVIESVGLEYFVPIISTLTIEPGQARVSKSLGGQVTDVCIINQDILNTSIFAFGSPIQQAIFSSDKMDFSDDLIELAAKRDMQFDNRAQANQRFACFYPVRGQSVGLDNVVLDLILNSTAVTAGNNVIVYRSMLVNPKWYERAVLKANDHRIANFRKAGLI